MVRFPLTPTGLLLWILTIKVVFCAESPISIGTSNIPRRTRKSRTLSIPTGLLHRFPQLRFKSSLSLNVVKRKAKIRDELYNSLHANRLRHDSAEMDNPYDELLNDMDEMYLERTETRQWWTPFRRLWAGTINRMLSRVEGPALYEFFLSGVRISLLMFISWEFFRIIRDTVQELQDDISGDGGSGGGTFGGIGTGGTMLVSSEGASKLVLWLQVRNQQQGKNQYAFLGFDQGQSIPRQPPPRFASPLAFRLAEQLEASGVPLVATSQGGSSGTSVESILPQLTRHQAELLHSCLVVPDPSISFEGSVSGLHAVKQALRQWIRQRRRQHRPSEKNDSSPFANFAQAASPSSTGTTTSGRPSSRRSLIKGMLLYGPPGCGKTRIVFDLAIVGQF